ncbi:MAG: hypothetical protein AB7K09_03670 [Planctomycetota bacterium]
MPRSFTTVVLHLLIAAAVAALLLATGAASAQDGPDAGPTADPAGSTSAGDPGADVAPTPTPAQPGTGETPPSSDPGATGDPDLDTPPPAEKPTDKEAEQAKRALRMAGWGFVRAQPHTHANVWLSHWNNDFKGFLHDLHAGFEFAFEVADFRISAWTILGARWQASVGGTTTGFDNWWIGGKMALALSSKGTFSIGTAIGLPIGKRNGGNTAIFTDASNGQLIAFRDFDWDIQAMYSLVGDTVGLNVDIGLNFAFGFPTTAMFQGSAEVVVTLMKKDPGVDLHAGFMFSTGYTPFIPYAEVALQLGDNLSFGGRAQVMIGDGPDFSNVADLVIIAFLDFRFDPMGTSKKPAEGGSGEEGAGDSGSGN